MSSMFVSSIPGALDSFRETSLVSNIIQLSIGVLFSLWLNKKFVIESIPEDGKPHVGWGQAMGVILGFAVFLGITLFSYSWMRETLGSEKMDNIFFILTPIFLVVYGFWVFFNKPGKSKTGVQDT